MVKFKEDKAWVIKVRTSTSLNLQILKWNRFSDLNASLAKKKKRKKSKIRSMQESHIYIPEVC